jgi:NitT/TauT family transport system substrate-binding protein
MSHRMNRTKLLGLVVAAGLIASACGGTAAPSPAPSATGTVAASATVAPGTLPKPEVTTLRIGISAPTEPVQYAEKLADQLGYYKELGFTSVTVTGFEGDGKALQALVAGQLDFFVGGASTAISTQLTDTPVKVVSINSVLNTDGLYCKSTIKTKDDVKGKAIAISTFGGTSHGSALIAVQLMGYTTKDVVIKEVGNEGTRVAALRGGSIDCAMVGLQADDTLKAAGFNLIVDVTKGGQWGRSGLMARTDFIQKNPNTVLNVVAASVRAQNYMWTNNADAATKFTEWSQQKPEDAAKVVKAFLDYGLRSMIFTEEAFKAPQAVLATVNPPMAGVDLKKAYDLSFLQKLVDNGYYAKYSIPTK